MIDMIIVVDIICVGDIVFVDVQCLFVVYGFWLYYVVFGELIFGSYWGELEVGIIVSNVYVCDDMFVYLMLYEVCYLIVLLLEWCVQVYIDVIDLVVEEDVICYLQIVLVGQLFGVGSQWLMVDMDVWGYMYWLGFMKVWFEQDVEDVKVWLVECGLLVV